MPTFFSYLFLRIDVKSDNSADKLLSHIQLHEEEDYNCPDLLDQCPYIGFKILQKIRLKTKFSSEALEMMKSIVKAQFLNSAEPSEELLTRILTIMELDDDFMNKLDKFCYLDASKQIVLVQKILGLLQQILKTYPEVKGLIERFQMKFFLEMYYNNKSLKVTPHVIDKILEYDEVKEYLKVILGDDWKVLGADDMSKIDKIIKAESKKNQHKKRCSLS